MSDLYTNTFVRQNGPTRPIYDYIKALARAKVCPLCNHRDVSTLDHHLSKAYHPAFALTPVNLVPACKGCNTDTLARRPTQAAEQTLHPYFDDVDDEVWLVASIVPDDPPAFVFGMDPRFDTGQPKYAIIQSHFEKFKLGALYPDLAASLASSLRRDIELNFANGGADFVASELRRKAVNAREDIRNSWQAAAYDAMADSVWFCGVGFACFRLRQKPGPTDEDVAKLSAEDVERKREEIKKQFARPARPKKAAGQTGRARRKKKTA
jgi:hypothetical protein